MSTIMATEYLVNYKAKHIDYPTVNTLLSSLWHQLNIMELPVSSVKKVYSISTECLENIYKYADTDETESIKIMIEHDGNYIKFHAENILKNVKVAKLEYNIDLVNSLDKLELKKLFKHKIQTRKISELGGAGLGLIIIARKIEGKISYNIKEINSAYSKFSFKAKIAIIPSSEELMQF